MKHRTPILALVICLCWLANADLAEAQQSAATAPTLSRGEALRLASERNSSIISESLSREATAQRATRARGPYVPFVFVRADYDDTSPFAGESRGRALGSEVGVHWQSRYGTRLSASAAADDELAGGSSPTHGGSVSLSATQPLLRDGWKAGAFTPVLEAEIDAAIQVEIFRQRLNDLLVEVESAYWSLAYAQDDLAIKTRSRDRARGQFEDTQANIARGILAEGDIYVVEENLVFFDEQLVRAEEALRLAQTHLAELLQLDPETELVASDLLDVTDLPIPVYSRSVELAQVGNPALLAEELRAERSRIRLSFDENQALPTLDLESSAILNGAGDSRAAPWGDIAAADRPDFRVGVTLEVPLSWETSDAQVAESKLQVRRQLTLLKEAETRLRFQIRDILTQLESQNRRLMLVRRRVELAGSKLQAQMDKYKNGISTLDEVVRFQRDLDSTLIGERRVQVELLVAYARLLDAQGTLHATYGIEVK